MLYIVLAYLMLYIVRSYLMLFAALSNAVCLQNASFSPMISANAFYFHVLSWFIDTVCLFHVLICNMLSAFNFFFFFLIPCSHRCCFYHWKGYVLSGEIPHKYSHYYYLNNVKQIDRHKILSHTPKQQYKGICLITKFSPKIDLLFESAKSNYRILKDDEKIGGIFVQPPIYASKQPPDLRHLLIWNTITDNEPECNKPCGKHRWNVCKHINTATNFLIDHKTVKPGNYNCDSANVVYLIHCKKCPEALYIGKTGGNFRYKFNNHTHSTRQKKLLPLPLHFNADDNNINDLKVSIFKCNFKDTKHRKLTGLQFIINFETNKLGFNKDISFLGKYNTFKH